ncbi:BrnA antitoxin family protein [Brevundimonas sp. PAMC22021]|uniref:BrnA antitoxin family protein n=1 Tax=Brevundimonas sp. PAMC22021 TaxID=2861285 RepID=UPI001C62A222|nr:BrnA antitoxin family protein [Brevundimonas sp. PAMC22021]QYF85976.1 BrnA antitoxin family protein [Brevundimonas sp. PAMC22021]
MPHEVDLTDPDNPEWTEADFARARPAREVLPESVLNQFRRSPGRPKAETPKKQVTLRLDADLLEHWRAQGAGWQSGINAALRRASGL